jgi:hypothetical protein
MSKIFAKLNLKDRNTLCVLNPPAAFRKELSLLRDARITDKLTEIGELEFVLAFVTQQVEVDKLSKTIAGRVKGDAIVWFAYPKGTSRKYVCDFNRDTGWNVIRSLGFDTVRQVAIDEDWTALRFRRTEFIQARGRSR